MRSPALAAWLMLLVPFLPQPAHGQGAGRSMDIDPSIRSAGMGGAASAVFWGRDLDHWSNPALLGYARGIRYEQGHTNLVPDFELDVELESRVLKAGFGGAGIVMSTDDPGPGGLRLDYGLSQGADDEGTPTGTFGSSEQVNSWGFGVSVARTLESVLRLARSESPGVSDLLDVSFGMNRKEVEIRLAPTVAPGRTVAYDWGLLVRGTPLRFRSETMDLRGGVSYAQSELSYNDDATVRFLLDESRVSRHRRHGIGAHFSASRIHEGRPPSGFFEHLVRGWTPLVSFGVAYERATIDGGEGTSGYRTRGIGVEATIASVLAFRMGDYQDREGNIEDLTWGYGVALPIGTWGGVSYDHARFPQADGLSDLRRHAFSAWIDPVAVWSSAYAPR